MAEAAKISAGKRQGRGERGIWLVAGVGALAAAFGLVCFFSRAPVTSTVAPLPRPAPAVGMVPLNAAATDVLTREKAELSDLTPLFLPTHWNAQPSHLPASADPGETVFENFPPELIFDQTTLALNFPAMVSVPAQPIEALAMDTLPRPLLGFGRVDREAEPLPSRGGFLEVQAADTGETVLALPLTDAAPPADVWAPLDFLIAVDSAGLIGAPQLIHGSGRDDVDAYFQAFLVQNFRLGARLSPGFFRLRVGP